MVGGLPLCGAGFSPMSFTSIVQSTCLSKGLGWRGVQSSGLNNRPTPDLAAVAQEGGETDLGLVDPNEGLGEIEGGWAPF